MFVDTEAFVWLECLLRQGCNQQQLTFDLDLHGLYVSRHSLLSLISPKHLPHRSKLPPCPQHQKPKTRYPQNQIPHTQNMASAENFPTAGMTVGRFSYSTISRLPMRKVSPAPRSKCPSPRTWQCQTTPGHVILITHGISGGISRSIKVLGGRR